MKTIKALVARNSKLFFRDKGMFLSALITPGILIILYGTFLAKVYKDSFKQNIPDVVEVTDKVINGTVAGQLMASLLAVSCITITFCINLTMVQDRANKVIRDFRVSPVKRTTIYLSYFISTVINSLLVNYVALGLCLAYVASSGWYLTAMDIAMLVLDIFILVMFGTTLSCVVCYPLQTQGQMNAVNTIISAGYGFLCGAYMPISNFGSGLQKVLSFFPGTYGTSLIKNHSLRGVLQEMTDSGFPTDVVDSISRSLDCKPKLLGNVILPWQMTIIMLCTVIVLAGIYLFMVSRVEKNN